MGEMRKERIRGWSGPRIPQRSSTHRQESGVVVPCVLTFEVLVRFALLVALTSALSRRAAALARLLASLARLSLPTCLALLLAASLALVAGLPRASLTFTSHLTLALAAR